MVRKTTLLSCALLAFLPAVVEAQTPLPPELTGAPSRPLKPIVWEVYLKSKSVDLRRAAASLIASEIHVGAFEPSDEPVLALRDTDREVQRSAADALWASGSKASKALPIIVALAKSPDKELRAEVFKIIVSIGPEATHAPLLLNGLKDKDQHVRMWSAVGLLMVNYPGTEHHPHIIEALTSKDWRFVEETGAAFCAAEYSALPLLERLMTDKDNKIRRMATSMVESIAGCTQYKPFPLSTLKQLERSLKDDDYKVVGQCLLAFKVLGERAKGSIPAVADCLKHSNSNVRWWAAETLSCFGKAGVVAIPALKAALDDKDEDVRKMVESTLTKLRELAKEAAKKSEKDP
jgi:HEAT repeat protein